MDMKDGLGGWLGIAPIICTGIQACSDYTKKPQLSVLQIKLKCICQFVIIFLNIFGESDGIHLFRFESLMEFI